MSDYIKDIDMAAPPPDYLSLLSQYFKEKRNTGAIRETQLTREGISIFTTNIGFLRKVILPWLGGYVKAGRLYACVQVRGLEGEKYTPREQRKLPLDHEVVAVFGVKAHAYRRGFVRDVNRRRGQ
jgi:hypothetical protein